MPSKRRLKLAGADRSIRKRNRSVVPWRARTFVLYSCAGGRVARSLALSVRPRYGRYRNPIVLLRAVVVLLAAASTPLAATPAQVPDTAVRVVVGFGVDTLGVPNHEAFVLWRSYLVSRPSCGQQSPLWSASERAR